MKQKVSVPFMLLGILFNVCLIAANLLETKVIQVFGITVTAGLLVFPISYIINDCIAEVWGFRKARLIIWSGFAMNFFVVMLGLIAVALPAAPFWDGAAHFNFVFRDYFYEFGVCFFREIRVNFHSRPIILGKV